MDPFSVLSVSTAVVTFIDITGKIVKRLHELSKAADIPEVFANIRTRLPLITNQIAWVSQIETTLNPEERLAFEQLVFLCHREVRHLKDIIERIKFEKTDTAWIKGCKVLRSLTDESKAQKISRTLQENLILLTQLQSTARSKQVPVEDVKPADQPPTYANANGVFLVPFVRDEHFVGRVKILQEIENSIPVKRRVSVAGNGGVGKSQVAIEFAYRFRETHPTADVFWVYGASVQRFTQAYEKIARKLQIPSWDDPDTDKLELVRDWLSETVNPFLLILDNADDISLYWPRKYSSSTEPDDSIKDLSRYIPSNDEHGHVLVTSRDARVAKKLIRTGNPIPLLPLEHSEATELFMNGLEDYDCPMDSEIVSAIIETLDCLPLAITQAASFIKEYPITPEEYLEALNNDEAEEFLEEELHDSRRDESSINSAFKAWKVSFDKIAKQNPRAAELLSLLAMLERQSIPRWMLTAQSLVISIGVLTSFHMVTTRAGSGSLQLHRLTQRFVQSYLKRTGTLQKYRESAVACVSKAHPIEIGFREWETCEFLAPHVGIVSKYPDLSEEASLDLGHVLCWAADYHVERGRYHEALQMIRRSLEIFRKYTQPGDDRLTAAMWMYGRILYYDARSEEALNMSAELFEEAFSQSDSNFWVHAETAFELAHLYYDIGNEKRCLEMGEASYKCWKAIEGPSSVRSLDNMHDFSLELAMFGREQEAIANWETILELIPRSDAKPVTAEIFRLRSMAFIAEFRGDASTAEQLLSQLITVATAAYKGDHVHIFDYRLCLTEQIMLQGRYGEAIEETKKILEDCKGRSEWRTEALCYETIAECYRRMKSYSHEEAPRTQCADFPARRIGEKNVETIEAFDGLARCYINQGKYSEAMLLLEKTYKWREEHQDTNHHDRLITTEMLGICAVYLGDDSRAGDLFLRTIQASPTPSPRLLINLCCTLANRQEWTELEARCREAIQSLSGQASSEEDSDDNDDGALTRSLLRRAQRLLITALEKLDRQDEAMQVQVASILLHEREEEQEDRSSASASASAPAVTATIKVSGLDPVKKTNSLAKPGRVVVQFLPVQPPYALQAKRRFGRIFHPKTWSS